MSMTLPLPPSLRDRLDDMARRVRRLRQLRGFSLLVLTLTLSAAVALLADFVLNGSLPLAVRLCNLAVWLALGAGVLVEALIRPLHRRLDAADLAAAVEKHYPDLHEQLTSSVELAASASPGNGSADLIARLLHETESQTRALDFQAVLPGRSTYWLAFVAGVLCLSSLVPVAIAPQAYGRLLMRFLLPWQAPHAIPDFTFAITPGSIVAAQGRSLTVAVYLSPRSPDIALPRFCSLILALDDGTSSTFDMAPDDASRPDYFTATLRPLTSGHYHIETGNAVSESCTLTVATPTDLASNTPRIVITPPTYAASIIEVQNRIGLVDLTALEHSTIAFHFAFDRPATAALIEWKPTGKGKPQTFTLSLDDEKRSATWTLSARSSGSYRLLIEGEHGLQTVREGGTIVVRPDRPPEVLAFPANTSPRLVRPTDRLRIDLRMTDDIAVAGAELLTRRNNEPESTEQLALDGPGKQEATIHHTLALEGKVVHGDTFSYRIRFCDNRPALFGGPQVRYHPEEGWIALKVDRQAHLLRNKEIIARHAALDKKLERIEADLKQEKRRADKLRQESRPRDTLTERDQDDLRELRQQNQAIERSLEDLARGMTAEPNLARRAQQIANKNLRPAEAALRDVAAPKASKSQRDDQLQKTDRELDAALRQLAELREANQNHAQVRLDQGKVEALADRQKELADRATKLSKEDPAAKKQAEEMAREQADIARELELLTKNSDLLKDALEAVRSQQAHEAAQQARELAQAQRDLARASDAFEKKRIGERLAELEKGQRDLAHKVEALARETAIALRANFARPLSSDDMARAAESLEQGNSNKAVGEQDRAARELDRLARDLDRLAEQAKNPREAARQLSRLQDDIARRVREEMARMDDKKPLADRLKAFEREQQALRQAVRDLDSPNRAEARAELEKANKEQSAVGQALTKKDPKEALAQMEKARQALRDLAHKLPEKGMADDKTPSLLPTPKQAEQARNLAMRQRALQKAAMQAEQQASKDREKDTSPQRRQQQARQEDLAHQTAELSRKLAMKANSDTMRQAARAAQRAESAMRSAHSMSQKGDQAGTQAQREQAAKALEEAAQQAEQSAQGSRRPGQAMPDDQAGKAVQEARTQMGQAADRMRQGGRQKAGSAMQQAAEQLSRAAEQLRSGPRSFPRPAGQAGENFDARSIPSDLLPHLGKRWGDLPGELRTRMVQQMKARYGDDYARSIKLYFEQLADTRGRP